MSLHLFCLDGAGHALLKAINR